MKTKKTFISILIAIFFVVFLCGCATPPNDNDDNEQEQPTSEIYVAFAKMTHRKFMDTIDYNSYCIHFNYLYKFNNNIDSYNFRIYNKTKENEILYGKRYINGILVFEPGYSDSIESILTPDSLLTIELLWYDFQYYENINYLTNNDLICIELIAYNQNSSSTDDYTVLASKEFSIDELIKIATKEAA